MKQKKQLLAAQIQNLNDSNYTNQRQAENFYLKLNKYKKITNFFDCRNPQECLLPNFFIYWLIYIQNEERLSTSKFLFKYFSSI